MIPVVELLPEMPSVVLTESDSWYNRITQMSSVDAQHHLQQLLASTTSPGLSGDGGLEVASKGC